MPKYNHLFSIAFSVASNEEDASDVTDIMLLRAVVRRLAYLTGDDEMLGACHNEQSTCEN